MEVCSKEDIAREIKARAAISRLSADDQTDDEQQMKEQKAVMVCDAFLFWAVSWFFLMEMSGSAEVGINVRQRRSLYCQNPERETLSCLSAALCTCT